MIDERRLDAEPMEDIGEFDGDITAADNDVIERGNSSGTKRFVEVM